MSKKFNDDQVIVVKVRVNDVTWGEAQAMSGKIGMVSELAIREVARAVLRRDVEVTAPLVTHRTALTPRGFFR